MNYTRDKFFVDTNLFVYAFDPSAGAKWKASTEILDTLWDHQTGVISTQVLQELFVGLTQKVKNPIPHRTAKGIISDLLHWPTVVNDGAIILRAIDLKGRYHFSFLGQTHSSIRPFGPGGFSLIRRLSERAVDRIRYHPESFPIKNSQIFLKKPRGDEADLFPAAFQPGIAQKSDPPGDSSNRRID